MMHYHYDEDEFECVIESRPCTVCHDDLRRCNGACNGMTSYGLKKRHWADVMRIREERRRKHEDEVLAEAEQIKRSRAKP